MANLSNYPRPGRRFTHSHERGQILPVALAGVVLVSVILMMLINTGNRAVVKSEVANVADAAALSGATLVAQQLNSMAYVNRAMVANHVGIGHMTAYVSWVRYVEDLITKINYITQSIPIVGQITTAMRYAAEGITLLAETEAEVLFLPIDRLNNFYYLAQMSAVPLLPINVKEVMEQVASSSGEHFEINSATAMSGFISDEAAPITGAVAGQYAKLASFLSLYNVESRNRDIVTLVDSTYGVSSQQYRGNMSGDWITGRDWNIEVAKKTGDGKSRLSQRGSSWRANDKLKIRDPYTFNWATVASGKANTGEFYSAYQGIHGYVNLSQSKSAHYVLPIVAAASKSQAKVYSRDLFGIEAEAAQGGLTGLAIAHVEFVRPKYKFDPIGQDEFASLFNPFWQARLVGSSIHDIAPAFKETSTWRGQ